MCSFFVSRENKLNEPYALHFNIFNVLIQIVHPYYGRTCMFKRYCCIKNDVQPQSHAFVSIQCFTGIISSERLVVNYMKQQV